MVGSVAAQLRVQTSSLIAPEVEELLDRSIDDLIKYRIVRYLFQNRSSMVSAEHIAEQLGFHSAEITLLALQSLAKSGVTTLSVLSDGQSVFSLTRDARTLGAIRGLLETEQSEMSKVLVARKLAAKSLGRARQWARKVKKRG